jgi:pimeloyl-ACP methyl ester carboxylesterase
MYSALKRGKIRRRLKFLLRYLLAASVLTIAALAILQWHDPILFRQVIVQPPRDIYFAVNELQPTAIFNKPIIYRRVSEPQKVVLQPTQKDEIRIVADLRIPDGDAPKPAALLLHGASPSGRKNALIRWIGFRLYEDGWITMAPDARGFGDTEDPSDIENPQSWDVSKDIDRCLNFLATETAVNLSKITVIGHSMGAGHALQGALSDERVSRLILIGPSRYLGGHIGASRWALVRFSADRDLDELVSENVYLNLSEKTDLRFFIENNFIRNSRKSILLIDGEREGMGNRKYLDSLAKIAGPNLRYHTLPDTAHYCGVASLPGTNYVFVRPDLFNPFFQVIESFMNTK